MSPCYDAKDNSEILKSIRANSNLFSRSFEKPASGQGRRLNSETVTEINTTNDSHSTNSTNLTFSKRSTNVVQGRKRNTQSVSAALLSKMNTTVNSDNPVPRSSGTNARHNSISQLRSSVSTMSGNKEDQLQLPGGGKKPNLQSRLSITGMDQGNKPADIGNVVKKFSQNMSSVNSITGSGKGAAMAGAKMAASKWRKKKD